MAQASPIENPHRPLGDTKVHRHLDSVHPGVIVIFQVAGGLRVDISEIHRIWKNDSGHMDANVRKELHRSARTGLSRPCHGVSLL